MPLDTSFLILGSAVILLAGSMIYQEHRLRKLLRGKSAASLEDTLHQLSREIDELKSIDREKTEYLRGVEERLRRSIQTVSTVRFNPFKDLGSNQSFAVAFLDEEGMGVVVSSLYSRDRNSVFAKPVNRYTSTYELTPEERRAIDEARK